MNIYKHKLAIGIAVLCLVIVAGVVIYRKRKKAKQVTDTKTVNETRADDQLEEQAARYANSYN